MRQKRAIIFDEVPADPPVGVALQYNPSDRECELWASHAGGVVIYALDNRELALFQRQVSDRMFAVLNDLPVTRRGDPNPNPAPPVMLETKPVTPMQSAFIDDAIRVSMDEYPPVASAYSPPKPSEEVATSGYMQAMEPEKELVSGE